jgi:dipeptidyl aminopeptidase/acylaminoacyl peptidase
VVSGERQGGSDVWMIDTIREGVATRLTMRPATSSYPVWSPDGTEIAFGSGGLLNVFHTRVFENKDEQRLTDSVNTQLPLDWSPDGSAILFYQITAATGRDLMIIPAPGRAGAPAAYLQTKSNEWWARFAPVQPPRWIAYQSDESGRWEVYVDTYPKAGGRRRISTGGGQFPEWGPGGRELFFVSPEYRLMSVQVTLGDTIDSSEPREYFRLPANDTGRRPYEVAPDGQRILVRAAPSLAAPLTVNTRPENTLKAFADHGGLGPPMAADGGDCETVLREFGRAGIDVDALAARLQQEGAAAFVKSWNELMVVIAAKSAALETAK